MIEDESDYWILLVGCLLQLLGQLFIPYAYCEIPVCRANNQ